ncbi:MAG: hypothetical protein IKH59_01810 [Bacteroidaceae bacterium]|nr:hypothetical protein [Bacteroidaceae bacterium]
MSQPDFRRWQLDKPGDFELFVKYDRVRFMEFTGMLNARLEALPVGSTLYVTECTSLPRQYNLIVKWFCWRAFLSRHARSSRRDKKTDKFVLYTMLPDYSGIRKTLAV